MKLIQLLLLGVVFLIACDDSDVFRTSEHPVLLADEHPQVSPDGTKLAYRGSYAGSGTDSSQPGLYVCNTDGTNKQWTGIRALTCRWFDSSVVLLRGSSTGAGFELFSVYPDSGVIATCPGDLARAHFDISEGGDTIVYAGPMIDSLWTASIRMYIRSTNFDTTLVSGIMPSLSPDGRKICYHRSGIRVLDLVTGEDRRAWPVGWYPDWGADTSTVLFSYHGGPVVRFEGTSPAFLAASRGGPFDYLHPYLWYAADGSDGYPRIWRLNTETEELIQITR